MSVFMIAFFLSYDQQNLSMAVNKHTLFWLSECPSHWILADVFLPKIWQWVGHRGNVAWKAILDILQWLMLHTV